VRAVLVNVERQGKGPQLMLSRASEMLKLTLQQVQGMVQHMVQNDLS